MKAMPILAGLLFFFLSVPASSQEPPPETDSLYNLTVRITNKKNKPISNIVLQAINSGKVGITDLSGLYVFEKIDTNELIRLFLPKHGETIVRAAGFDSLHVAINSKEIRYYNLQNQEPIDFGYISVSKYNNSSSATSLNVSEQLNQTGARNLIEFLRGRVAGLDIDPYGAATIRGINSIMLSTEPLVIIDGTPIGTLREASEFVNIHDIQSVSILKDGSLYGSRGSNGVIVITTKK